MKTDKAINKWLKEKIAKIEVTNDKLKLLKFRQELNFLKENKDLTSNQQSAAQAINLLVEEKLETARKNKKCRS